ncbi:hypothetical protein VNO78_33767 [Psophocarpus tetragonolobus]|uniref:Uncharacterized protein n=1 Tax=Psophocarpus tetragonolobus TaxID=3891 RepID=A0AAN9NXW9_PSOTE
MGKKEGIIGFWNQIGYGACIGDHTGHFIAATADYEVAALDVKDVLHHYPLFSVNKKKKKAEIPGGNNILFPISHGIILIHIL